MNGTISTHSSKLEKTRANSDTLGLIGVGVNTHRVIHFRSFNDVVKH